MPCSTRCMAIHNAINTNLDLISLSLKGCISSYESYGSMCVFEVDPIYDITAVLEQKN
jgi:hypothetical protein